MLLSFRTSTEIGIIIVFILVFCSHVITFKQKRQIAFPDDEENVCTTPNRKSGKCIALVRCKSLSNNRDVRLLRASICGFEDDMPKVCCPSNTNNNIIPPTKRPPNRSTTKKRRKPIPTVSVSTDSNREGKDIGFQSDSSENEGITLISKPRKLPENCGNSSVTQLTRIVGGKAATPGAWPWMAAIYIEDSGKFTAQCGGALISNEDILTASHCVVENGNVKSPSSFVVRLGEHNIEREAKEDADEDFEVIKVIAHPEFEPKVYKNDIAILKLAKKVRFNRRIWPICLPYDTRILQSKENVGRSGYITGWGRTEFNGKQSDVLQEASIEIVSQEECGKAFKSFFKISDVYICAGITGSTKDSCQGDSGGPLFQIDPNNRRYYLTGIVSFGRRCATPGFPGVYTRVSHFLNWISNNI